MAQEREREEKDVDALVLLPARHGQMNVIDASKIMISSSGYVCSREFRDLSANGALYICVLALLDFPRWLDTAKTSVAKWV